MVGVTNVGKSTLFNHLKSPGVLEAKPAHAQRRQREREDAPPSGQVRTSDDVEDDEEEGKIGTPKVAGYNEAKIKTMTSAFQNTLIRCVRRLAIELFCIALCGLIALSDIRVFKSFMDMCLFVAMVDVLWSTKSYLWGVEIENKANKKDGKGVSNKYSQETTAVSVGGTGIPVPVEVEEASSSEDDEGEDNTFFFPIAIQQIKTSMGPLSQSKRYSIRS